MADLAARILKAAQLAAPIYAAHGWEWGGYDSPRRVPSAEEIADTIKSLYDDARDSDSGVISSGRLTVYRDDDDGSISVEVQLAELRNEVPGWDAGRVPA